MFTGQPALLFPFFLLQNYPLADDAQQLLCEVEESVANLYFYQLKKTDATRWYNKALQSVERLLEGLDHEDGQQVGMETRGMSDCCTRTTHGNTISEKKINVG